MDLLKSIIGQCSIFSELYTKKLVQNSLAVIFLAWSRMFTRVHDQYTISYTRHSGISGADRFYPLDITPYGRQILITNSSDDDNIFDSDPTHRFVFLKDIMIDMSRISYSCQKMR